MQNANSIKFRCSSLGYLMTEPKKKTETLSESTKTHLIDVFISAKYKRREDIKSKFLDKGNEREEDAITLLSLNTKTFYKKNLEHLNNDLIMGTPDLFKGVDIFNADETNDTKCSWSAHTYFRSQKDELNPLYKWQGVGYMILTGAKKHTVSYCLVNGTAKAINDEKRRLAYALGIIDNETPEYIEKCKQIEINHIFDMKSFEQENGGFDLHNDNWNFDIPKEERLFQFTFNRDESEIERLHKRISDCRNWMNLNLFNK